MAIFISILALLVTASIALAAWVQTHNAVRPFLHSNMSIKNLRTGRKEQVIVTLHNSGAGPAIITDFYVECDGKEYRDDNIHELMTQHFHGVDTHILRPNGAIQAGIQTMVLAVNISDKNGSAGDIKEKLLKDFILVVKYKSFLDYNMSIFGKYLSFLGFEETYKSTDHEWPAIESAESDAVNNNTEAA